MKAYEIKKRKIHKRIKRVVEQQYFLSSESFRIGRGPYFLFESFFDTRNIRKRPLVFFDPLFGYLLGLYCSLVLSANLQ